MARMATKQRAAAAVSVAGLGAPVTRAAYGWAVRSMLRRAVRRLRDGDVDSVLRLYADDVRFVFPGRHSWTADFSSKAELEPWLRRFARVGLRLEPHEILIQGPPWNTVVCVRFTDEARAPDGSVVYANRGVIFGRIKWGRIVFEEANEDTQKVADFDAYLAEHEPRSG